MGIRPWWLDEKLFRYKYRILVVIIDYYCLMFITIPLTRDINDIIVIMSRATAIIFKFSNVITIYNMY